MKKLLSTGILIMFIASAFAQHNCQIVHEWGTFTTLSTSEGDLLSGLHWEEEELPSFVYHHVYDSFAPPSAYYSKGFQFTTRIWNVTVKMETPVLYFYSEAAAPQPVNVRVDFPRGSISEWFPQRSKGEFKHYQKTIDFADDFKGWIEWDALVLPPNTEETMTYGDAYEKPIWDAPRATKANLVKGPDGNVEKYLFYRGIGNFEIPVKLEFNIEGNLVITNEGTEVIPYLLVYEKKNNESRVYWTGKLDGKKYHVVYYDEIHSSPYNVQNEMTAFHAALVKAGLYADEAAAMLDTWQSSYFEKDGLKVFWILPDELTNQLLPIQITPQPCELERVLVGRSEILTPAFEEKIKSGNYPGPSDRFYSAYWQRANQLSENPDQQWSTTLENMYENLSLFPNPTTHEITATVNIPPGSIEINIRNLLGQQVATHFFESEKSNFSTTFSLAGLSNGIYMVEVRAGEKIWQRKVVKQ
ncbi:MAG: T9SS type A sorting domain-containing protein [Bacteroidia bacterium]